MTMRGRERSILLPKDVWGVVDPFPAPGFNQIAHSESHDAFVLPYTSNATLDTVISTPIMLPFDVAIVDVWASVTGAPSATDLIWDVLIDGDSAFAATGDRIRIDAGEYVSRSHILGNVSLPFQSKLQVQGVTLSSATGPLIVYFRMVRV